MSDLSKESEYQEELKKAALYLNSGQFEQSEEILITLVKNNFKPAYRVYSVFYSFVGDKAKTWEYALLAYDYNPKDPIVNSMIAGEIYHDRNNITKRPKSDALQYYLVASEHDIPNCIGRVGYMYEFGEGVEQDFKKARSYYLRASDLGHVGSRVRIANTYKSEKNYFKYFIWKIKTLPSYFLAKIVDDGSLYFG